MNEIPRTAAAAMAQPEGMTLPAPFQFGTAAPLHAEDMRQAMQQLQQQQAAAQAAGIGAQQAVDIHRPDRPNWSLRQMFGMAGPGLRGFLQGQSVPRPVPGFGGDVMPGIMRPSVPGMAPGIMMPQSTQQAYDTYYAALMAQQTAGPGAIAPVTTQPGSAPVAGAMLGSAQGVARPGAPGIQPPRPDVDPLAPLPPGFLASLGTGAQRFGGSVTGAAASAVGAANRVVGMASGPLYQGITRLNEAFDAGLGALAQVKNASTK